MQEVVKLILAALPSNCLLLVPTGKATITAQIQHLSTQTPVWFRYVMPLCLILGLTLTSSAGSTMCPCPLSSPEIKLCVDMRI